MGNDKQIQKAGDNSQLYQAGTIVVNNGITEERARAICDETSKKAIEECSIEARRIAEERIAQLANVLIPRLQQVESDFHSLSEPDYQVLLRKAQITAACSGKKEDYKILSELLIHRIKNKTDVKKKASISKAVEIIDQIDEDSLLGLTVFHAICSFCPLTGIISDGLKVLDALYSEFNLDDLPTDEQWLDNLSILGAIIISHIGTLKKFKEIILYKLSGYACAGIKKDSDNYFKAIDLLLDTRFNNSFMINNELMEGYVRLPIRSLTESAGTFIDPYFLKESKYSDNSHSDPFWCDFTELEKERFKDIISLYEKDPAVINEMNKALFSKIDSFLSIKKVMSWWDSLKPSIHLTSVGKVIAHTNAKSIDDSLPDLD